MDYLSTIWLDDIRKLWYYLVFRSLYTFKRTNENDLYKYTNWINLRPMYIRDNIIKSDKIDNRLYLMQEVKAKSFLKLNNGQEELN